MTTTTSPLMLSGDDLEDARTLALWGVYADAYSYRDTMLPGAGSHSPGDPTADLISTLALAGALATASGYSTALRELSAKDVQTLERLALEQIDTLTVMNLEPEEVVAYWTARAAHGERVLALVERLRSLLPQAPPPCPTCGSVPDVTS